MLLRIFLFGLIAIARASDHVTVLVLDSRDNAHDPYVAFDQLTCPDCVPYHLPHVGRSVLGHPLQEGYELAFAPYPGIKPPQGLTYAMVGTDPKLPRTVAEAADFRWVTSIPAILGQAGTATKCARDPKHCPGHHIVARTRLTAGALQTCHLVTTLGSKCDVAVYPFSFDSPVFTAARPASRSAAADAHASKLLPQAMASVVEVEIKVGQIQDLTLTLTRFGADRPEASITLKPTDCQGPGHVGEKCVDVFVGNISKEDYSDPLSGWKARHFPEYFDLLDTSASAIVPTLDQSDCVYVQPYCRQNYPGVNSDMRKVDGRLRLRSYPEGSFSRPICPMAMVAE